MPAMTPMTTMPAMHEDMQERTGEEQQPRQEHDDVTAMLGPQEVAADREEGDQHEAGARGQEAAAVLGLVIGVIVGRHVSLPLLLQ
jgi:hypothetical protein